MRNILALGVSVLAAALAPAVLFELIFLLMGTNTLFPLGALGLVFCVSLAHAAGLGLPAMLVLLRVGRFGLWEVLCCGFAVGSASVAVLVWPPFNGWLQYLQTLLSAGALGGIGAAAFYFTFKGLSPDHSFKPKPLRGSA